MYPGEVFNFIYPWIQERISRLARQLRNELRNIDTLDNIHNVGTHDSLLVRGPIAKVVPFAEVTSQLWFPFLLN